MESLRETLYPIGFLATFVFAIRFLIQWISSEKKKRSYTPPIFWKLSIIGSSILLFHSIIQLQLPVALIQGGNSVIAWRNLNLMQAKKKPISYVLILFSITFLLTIALFSFSHGNSKGFFMRAPLNESIVIHPLIHVVGIIGMALFSMRFWLQWMEIEKNQRSELSLNFWLVSFFGSLLSLFYFIRIYDPVNIIGPMLAAIPYTRNIFLILKQRKA